MGSRILNVEVVEGYDKLALVLVGALEQAQSGKGKERHSVSGGTFKPFDQQPICTLGRIYGLGYNLGQAAKKAHEVENLSLGRAKAELLGAINYLAAAYILLDERDSGTVDMRDAVLNDLADDLREINLDDIR